MTVKNEKEIRIAGVQIFNFCGVTDFSMKEAGILNVISGGNMEGKTAILNAIKHCLWAGGHDPLVINTDSDEAQILIQLTNGVNVDRRVRKTVTDLKVSVKTEFGDDSPISAAQTYLKKILGANGLTFNPIKFFNDKPPEQRRMILQASPFTLTQEDLERLILKFKGVPGLVAWSQLDFSQHGLLLLEQIKESVFTRRQLKNQDVTRLKKSLEQDKIDFPDTTDRDFFDNFDMDDAMNRIQIAQGEINQHESNIESQSNLGESLCEIDDGITQANSEIAGIHEKVDGVAKQSEVSVAAIANQVEVDIAAIHEKAKKDVAAVHARVKESGDQAGKDLAQIDERVNLLSKNRAQADLDIAKVAKQIKAYVAPDIAAIKGDVERFNSSQKLIVKLEDIDRRSGELLDEQKVWKNLDLLHKLLANDVPKAALKEIDMPIDDLTFEGDNVLVGGVDLAKLATSEKMGLAMSMAESLCGDLKLICVDGAEALDTGSFQAFLDKKKTGKYQYFMTVVTGGPLKVDINPDKKPVYDPEKEKAE